MIEDRGAEPAVGSYRIGLDVDRGKEKQSQKKMSSDERRPADRGIPPPPVPPARSAFREVGALVGSTRGITRHGASIAISAGGNSESSRNRLRLYPLDGIKNNPILLAVID